LEQIMHPRHKLPAIVAMAAAITALTAIAGHAAAGPKAAPAKPDCFTALRQPTGARFICEHQTWMTDQERADLTALTRGYLLDARCTVAVDVERRLIDEAMAASDRVFTAPPQPVTCQITTSGGPMTVSGTFAPHVVLKEGFAVSASPGLGNITGVNSYLAMPVVAWVNHAPAIGKEMAAMINELRGRSRQQQAAR
jgi:hypothetical protein